MKLTRGDLALGSDDHGAIVLTRGAGSVELTADELRWLALAAGPSVLVELARREGGS